MAEDDTQTRAQQLIGDFAPKLVSLTDDVLFGDVWARTELSPRDRSLVTVAALITGGNTEQLGGHLDRARRNGLTEDELKEVIIHLAFYAGWPRAMSAVRVAKHVFERSGGSDSPRSGSRRATTPTRRSIAGQASSRRVRPAGARCSSTRGSARRAGSARG
jgi:4-carboxymuconolactone decarboxylase